MTNAYPDGADRGTILGEQLGYPFEDDDIEPSEIDFYRDIRITKDSKLSKIVL